MRKLLTILAFCFMGSTLFAGPIDSLMMAAASGNTSKVVQIISSGAVDVNAKDINGWTAIMYAAEDGHTETVTKLKELGADVNAKELFGKTVLMFAAENGHTDTVVKLIELGAGVNAKTDYGYTALMFCAENGKTETVVALAEKGAELNAKDSEGWTALSYAKKNGNTATANVIKKLGAFDDSMWENTRQKILLEDARAYLLKYTGDGAGASDREIALGTLSKIYAGLLSENLMEYDESTSAIAKEGNLDFLMGVKLEAGTPLYLSYTKTIAVLKNVNDVFKALDIDKSCRAGYEIAPIKNLKTDIEALRTELKSLKGIK
jgi:hypothetical protein